MLEKIVNKETMSAQKKRNRKIELLPLTHRIRMQCQE